MSCSPQIASGADERDRETTPSFPEGAMSLLERAGMLAWNARPGTVPAARRRPNSSS